MQGALELMVGLSGRARRDRGPSGRHAAAGGRRARRAHRAHGHPRGSRGPRQRAQEGHHPRHGARHEPGDGRDVRLRDGDDPPATSTVRSTSRRSRRRSTRTSRRSCSRTPTRSACSTRTSLEITAAVHAVGALAYCDGANLNAILGKARPGDMGFDAMHINLHKTFSTPHGGGGPGAGPVCVTEELAAVPARPARRRVRRRLVRPRLARALHRPRALASTATSACSCAPTPTSARSAARGCARSPSRRFSRRTTSRSGSRARSTCPYDRTCMHEFVLSRRQAEARERRAHARHRQAAARLRLPPADVYFPLLVDEAMMIEPTETEPLAALDAFADAMLAIAEEAASRSRTREGRALHDARAPPRRGRRRAQPRPALDARGGVTRTT